MLDYDPVKKELSSRDVVARSIYKEVQAGRGTPHGGAYLDVRHRGADYIKSKLPSMYEQFHALASIDITKQPMEVGPTIHYTMGGVRVDAETAATTVRVCTPPVRSPAGCTAPTGWAATRSATSSCSAGARARPPPQFAQGGRGDANDR